MYRGTDGSNPFRSSGESAANSICAKLALPMRLPPRLLGALLAGGHVRSPLDDRLFTGAGPPRNARRRSRPGSRKRGLSAKGSLTVAGMIRAAPDPSGTTGQFLRTGRQAIEFFKPPPLARPSTAYKASRILVNSRNERAKACAISKHMVLFRKRDTR